jgi:anti-anti-sigma regulatory factor
LPGKPSVTQWTPPPVTQQKEDFAKLTSIDLSLLDSDDPAVVQDLVNQVKRAIREDGFLFLENYGVSIEQVCNPVRYKDITANLAATAPSPVRYRTIYVQQYF